MTQELTQDGRTWKVKYLDHNYANIIRCNTGNVGDCDCPIIIKTFSSRDAWSTWWGSLSRAWYDDVVSDDKQLKVDRLLAELRSKNRLLDDIEPGWRKEHMQAELRSKNRLGSLL